MRYASLTTTFVVPLSFIQWGFTLVYNKIKVKKEKKDMMKVNEANEINVREII